MGARVLFVCLGNICRSPMAERLLRARVVPAAGIEAASAGTRAVVGYGMDRAAAAVLRELGGDPDGHVAQQLTSELVAGADLVLTMTLVQRDQVLRAEPATMQRTFSLREFVRLGAEAQPMDGAVADRVRRVAMRRGQTDPPGPGADDIGDPYGAPRPVMEEAGRQISAAVDQLIEILAPCGPAGPGGRG